MATYVTRTLSDGTVRHRVEFKSGGRDGRPYRITFADESTAKRFKKLIEAYRNTMPDDEALRRAGFGFLVDTAMTAERGSDVITLADYATRYLATKNFKARQRQKYESMVRDHLADFFDGVDIRDITRADLRDWQQQLVDVKELSAKTVRNIRGLLVPMLREACQRGDRGETPLLTYSPLDGLAPPPAEAYHRDILYTDQHVRIVFDAARAIDPYAADLLFVLACLGLRWSEAAALMPDACLLGATVPQVIIRRTAVWERGKGWHLVNGAKTRAGVRKIPLFPAVARVLADRVANTPAGQLVFGRPGDGAIWPHGCFYRDRWQPIVALAQQRGLPHHLTIHGLRKSTLTLLAESGVDPVTLRQFAGHESHVTTLRLYTDATGRGRGALVDALAAFYGEDAA